MNRTTTLTLALIVLAGLGLTVWAINKRQAAPPVQEKSQASEFKTSPDGIRYLIEKEGEGRTPAHGERVQVHYTGWLDQNGQEGEKFDSSLDRGRPFMFNVGMKRVIQAWDSTLADMKEGEVRYIILPPELGYGSMSVGSIPANSTLRFRIALLKIG